MSSLSPAKVILLAVDFAVRANIDGIRHLAFQNRTVLTKVLVLRILLTYLPETVPVDAYTGFIHEINHDLLDDRDDAEHVDSGPVDGLSEDQARRRVRKLRLLELSSSESATAHTDPLTLFLFQRSYKIEDEAGLLNQVVDLLIPFLDHAPDIRVWMASTVLPLFRRNSDYHSPDPTSYSLRQFENLSDRASVEYLLSQTGRTEDTYDKIGRDLRGLVAPWLCNSKRWSTRDNGTEPDAPQPSCPGWDQCMDWLLLHASKSWRVAVRAIEQWDGPRDADFGESPPLSMPDNRLQHLDRTYARASLASAYLVPEGTAEALEGAYRILTRVKFSLTQEQPLPLEDASRNCPTIPPLNETVFSGRKVTAASLRNDLLEASNSLTSPQKEATEFLQGLILSAFILTRLGIVCTVRRAGDLVLLRDEREQKGEVVKLIRLIAHRAPKNDDEYWKRTRGDLLWLHNWGNESYDPKHPATVGVFGLVSKDDIEVEILKALLTNMRYTLAKSLYEDATVKPLSGSMIQDAVYHSALDAFDNASNPNRTKGGLKKCNDIINALPKTVPKSMAIYRQIESLLSAAHSLSRYRLVLKQGEPFSPVVLRVHSDPISIIDKVFEQNKGAYTRLQEFLDMGSNMVVAGFPTHSKRGKSPPSPEQEKEEKFLAEKRIIAMCVSAALKEEDFETAYSYVASRLGHTEQDALDVRDDWSWSAALKAGQYVRTYRSQQPTHLGTSSGNLEIRHLEQRLECLATALRVAPATKLQDILVSFRQCEEQLDAAVVDEAAKEAAWDAAGDMQGLPGAFDMPGPEKSYPARNITAAAAARQAEEAPMSLFDLSRATARLAQRNLTSLASLQGMAESGDQSSNSPAGQAAGEPRVRKRDQFREAATGTLVSGVGWLIGAKVNQTTEESQ